MYNSNCEFKKEWILKKLKKVKETRDILFNHYCINKLNMFDEFSESFVFKAKLYVASLWKTTFLSVWFNYNRILTCHFKLCCRVFYEFCFNIWYFTSRGTNVWLIILVYREHGNKVKGDNTFPFSTSSFIKGVFTVCATHSCSITVFPQKYCNLRLKYIIIILLYYNYNNYRQFCMRRLR